MTATYGSTTVAARRAGRATVPAGWFVLVVLAGSAISLLHDLAGLPAGAVPVQTSARALLVLLVVVGALTNHGAHHRMPPEEVRGLGLPICLFVASPLASVTVACLTRPEDAATTASAFVFMYGVGALIALHLVAPLGVHVPRLFTGFCAAAVAFGAVQALRQDLMLPDAFLDRFGILFEEFVNGRIRVVGFLASAPRFAELLVLSVCFLVGGLGARRRRPLLVLATAIVLFVLYNTFSRSGYVLLLTALASQLLLARSQRRRDGDRRRRPPVLALLGAAGAVLAVGSGRLPLDAAVADGTSFHARLDHWGSLVSQVGAQGGLETLFGTATAAQFAPGTADYFVVDNLALAVFLYGGLVGVATTGLLYVAVVGQALRQAASSESRAWHPVIAFLVGLVAEGIFVDNHNTLFLTMFALVGMIVWERRTTVDRAERPPGRG